MSFERRNPRDFLDLLEKSKRGRLKIYLGYAAGVGKTYRMLEEAHSLKNRGVDIVLGYIEAHGRQETAALIEGLELVPVKEFEYRGVVIREMDLEGIIARRPQIVIVDELAHTNAPLCRNRKRYQDVLEILKAGINVICAFNIQHLESLNELVERTTGVAIREKIPDTFLKEADQIVTLDLAIEDLLERLRDGRVYPEEKITAALENFFRERNLSVLRELSLREVAESLERSSRVGEAPALETGRSPGQGIGRIMVCIASASPNAGILLSRGSRMAGRLNTHWFAVYVETPGESPTMIDSGVQRILLANTEKARELGAEVVRLHSNDPVSAILDFARSHGVGHIVVGRSDRPWWRNLFGRSFLSRLIAGAKGLDVHVVSFETTDKSDETKE